MLGMLFDVFSFISTHISSVLFSHVVQKQTLDEVERLFDGQLYQKYSYWKLLKLDISSPSVNW